MLIRRPTPAQILARKLEIKRRYASKAKVGKRTRSMAAIRLSELTRWLEHTHGPGQLPATEQSLTIMRIFAHHMGGLPDAARRITSWTARYAPWLAPRDLERLISEVASCPLKWSADKLAWKLGLTDAKRSELKIRTIGAIDCNREQREARRRQQRAIRDKARNAAKRSKRSPSI